MYAPAALEVDLALRSRAAGLLVAGRGAVAGYAAAELWGASCAPSDEPAHVLMTERYGSDGLRVHRDYFDFDETVPIDSGGVLTTPERTAYDLARWAPQLVERVVALDALAHRGANLDAVRTLRHRYLGSHGGADIAEALRLSDGRSESPMETRVRVPLVLAGLRPEVQYPVIVNEPPIPARPRVSGAVDRGGVRRCGSTGCRLGRATTSCARRTCPARDGGSSGSTLLS